MKRQLNIKISIWAKDAVERVALSQADSFSYHIQSDEVVDEKYGLNTFFEAYLRGENPPPPPLNLEPLTPFTRKVLEALKTIPFGERRTYGELATQIGCLGGARAVGGALGRNPFPLFLPCHRVLAQGGIGGFSAGIELKSILLDYERLF